MEISNDAVAVARRFLAALNAADADAVREIYAPDVRIWHNFDGKLKSVEENIKTLLWIHRKLDNVNYDVQRLEAIPGGYLQQHILRGTLPSGAPFAMPACAVCKVENGRITSLEEYMDVAHTQPLMT